MNEKLRNSQKNSMTKKKNRTYIVRETEIMLDKDLAKLFDIETKQLNRRVKRHIDKFFDERFQLTDDEYNSLRCQNGTSNLDFGTLKKRGEHSKYAPFAFTRKGVEILVDILKKEVSLDFYFEAKNEINLILKNENLTSIIYNIRGLDVVLDFDVATLYDVKSTRLREQVKRNIKRFPDDFMIQLSDDEINLMVSQNAIPSKSVLGGSNPYAFTEQGIASLSSVLTSDKAIEVNIKIMRAFVEMRKTLQENSLVLDKINNLEKNQLKYQIKSDDKFEQIFSAIEANDIKPKQIIFFDGQVFDAYTFVSGLIREAKKSIMLVDNYIDDTVLTLLSKREKNVSALIFTHEITKKLKLDLVKHNKQYPKIDIKKIEKSHDRFLIIDDELYHIGASLKDLGKKWFGFTKFKTGAKEIINKLKTCETRKKEKNDIK